MSENIYYGLVTFGAIFLMHLPLTIYYFATWYSFRPEGSFTEDIIWFFEKSFVFCLWVLVGLPSIYFLKWLLP